MEDWRSELITRSSAMEDLLAAGKAGGGLRRLGMHLWPIGHRQGAAGAGDPPGKPRAQAPFVAVNCGAIPEGLLESELFGHKKGSFTRRGVGPAGLFQAAQGGTLFLDEVGDMPLPLQVKLLRALEERKVRPVGTHESHDIDVRVISATHRKLEERIASGEFREDLYYRLNVVKLYIPGCRRREDIPLLANHSSPAWAIATEGASWPFRQRRCNCLSRRPARQRAPAAQRDGAGGGGWRRLRSSLIPSSARRSTPGYDAHPARRGEKGFERDYLVRILKITGGNVTRQPGSAGRNRTEFYRLLERHSLEPAMFKAA